MKIYSLFIISLSIIICSCNKDNDDTLDSNLLIPQKANVDLNNDSIDDFIVHFVWGPWEGVNNSGYYLTGDIEPQNDNLLLSKQNKNAFFIQQNDTIKVELSDSLSWKNTSIHFVTMSNDLLKENYSWPTEWIIQNHNSFESYFIGIKLIENNSSLIGWMKIEISSSTGEIKISDKQITSDEYIVINK